MERKQKFVIEILYEDNHLIAVSKPAGVLVQGDNTGDLPLVEDIKKYLKKTHNKPGNVFCGLIHRLDRPVSGVVVFARTSKALQRMTKLFKERNVEKTYWALVSQKPPLEEGEITHFLIKNKDKNITEAYNKAIKNSIAASLSYKILAKVNKYYLLEIHPLTGRSHQIRVQLAKIGCPIKGDIKYGYPKANKNKNIHLHAKYLRFIHPTKKEKIELVAPLPKDQAWDQYRYLSDD